MSSVENDGWVQSRSSQVLEFQVSLGLNAVNPSTGCSYWPSPGCAQLAGCFYDITKDDFFVVVSLDSYVQYETNCLQCVILEIRFTFNNVDLQ